MNLKDYQVYNSSFGKKFIYRLGGFTGFFSEYNNMILAMHYCMVNHIQFVLESENANFSSGKGWNEFFLPFCEEKRNKWLNRFNHRIKPVYKDRWEWFCFNVYKKLHPRNIYMFLLFDTVRKADTEKKYEVKELGLKGTLLENCSEIHKMVWRYNEMVSKDVEKLIEGLNLPQEYIGMHIRQGDKVAEAELFSPRHYMNHAMKFSDSKNVFVLTDDYRVIMALKNDYPQYSFYTFCQPDENGYDLFKLNAKPQSDRIQSYLRLWASMDILEKAQVFVGTYSANPGMNMGFRMEKDRIKCVDFDKWQLW